MLFRSFFIVRFPWKNVPLETADGQPFSLLDALRTLPEACAGEFAVRFVGPNRRHVPVRLVAIRKSEPKAAEARQRALREGRHRGYASVDVGTLEAAGYVFVLTNLPETISADNVLELYRIRWQIEMKFKTLKSILHLDQVPAHSDEGVRVYVLAKLMIALLIDSLIHQAESISPWGYPLVRDQ